MRTFFYRSSLVAAFVALFLSFAFAAHAFTLGGGGFGGGGSDNPGDGFEEGEDCGYVYGSASVWGPGQVLADAVDDDFQWCVDENGYIFGRNFYITHSSYGDINLASTGSNDYDVVIDYSNITPDGKAPLIGFGKFDVSPGTGMDYLQFNHAFPASSVYVDIDTGLLTGFAWNADPATGGYGYLNMTGLYLELPPSEIQTFVEFLSYDEVSATWIHEDEADLDTAPLADGYDYWMVKVSFIDDFGRYLDETDVDVDAITVRATEDSFVFVNQIKNMDDAIIVSGSHPSVLTPVDCSSAGNYCIWEDESGNTAWVKFITSAGPTYNMVGLNTDTDVAIENKTDRDGCVWIYDDQVPSPPKPACKSSFTDTDSSDDWPAKEDVYYNRGEDDRNKYEIEYVTIGVEIETDATATMYTYGEEDQDDAIATEAYVWMDSNLSYDYYRFYPADDERELSWAPRFRGKKFVAVFDTLENTYIQEEEMSKSMRLVNDAYVTGVSQAMLDVGSIPDTLQLGYTVYYQLEVDTESDPGVPDSDRYLLMDDDSDTPEDIDATTRTDTIADSAFVANYTADYLMLYEQKPSECAGTPGCPPASNTVTDPTAEQWVCDEAPSKYDRYNSASCYYTGYLPIEDPSYDAEDGLLMGAISSSAGGNLTDTDELAILGTSNTITLRNNMYAQFVRYALGLSGTPAGGTLDSNMEDNTGGVESLVDGRLMVAYGDVTVSGSTSFDDTTLVVVGGDIYIEGDVTGGKLGVVAFKSGGTGGDVYIDSSVTDLHANIFIDGALYSDSGSYESSGEPTWANDDMRENTLNSQLYIKGSLISRNTIGGAESEDAGSWDLGDGSTTTNYDLAVEHDLNFLRQYHLCAPIGSDGRPDWSADPVECEDGGELSDFTMDEDGDGTEESVSAPFILEYDPPADLVVFSAWER